MEQDDWPAPPPPPDPADETVVAGEEHEPVEAADEPVVTGPPPGPEGASFESAPPPTLSTPVLASSPLPSSTAILPVMPVDAPKRRGKAGMVVMSVLAAVGLAAAVVLGFLFIGKSSDNDDLKAQLSASELDYADQTKVLDQTKTQLTDATSKLSDTSTQLADTQADLDDTTTRAEQAEAKAKDLDGQLKAATTRADTAEGELEKAKTQNTDLTGQLDEATKRADKAEQEIADAEAVFVEQFAKGILGTDSQFTDAQAKCLGQYIADHTELKELLIVAGDPDNPSPEFIRVVIDGLLDCNIPLNGA